MKKQMASEIRFTYLLFFCFLYNSVCLSVCLWWWWWGGGGCCCFFFFCGFSLNKTITFLPTCCNKIYFVTLSKVTFWPRGRVAVCREWRTCTARRSTATATWRVPTVWWTAALSSRSLTSASITSDSTTWMRRRRRLLPGTSVSGCHGGPPVEASTAIVRRSGFEYPPSQTSDLGTCVLVSVVCLLS